MPAKGPAKSPTEPAKVVSALILAAGKGQRLGGVCKATLKMGNDPRTFLERIVETLRDCDVAPFCVFGGPHADQVRAESERLKISAIPNPNAAQGMATSISIGFRYLCASQPSGTASFIWPVDQPFVTGTTIQRLLKLGTPERIVIPSRGDRRGHPPLVGRTHWPRFSEAETLPQGAKTVLSNCAADIMHVDTDDSGILKDVDHPGDLCEI